MSDRGPREGVWRFLAGLAKTALTLAELRRASQRSERQGRDSPPWKYPSTRLFTDQEERTARCPVAYGSAKPAEQSVAGPIVGGLGGFVDATWQGGNVRPNVLVAPASAAALTNRVRCGVVGS